MRERGVGRYLPSGFGFFVNTATINAHQFEFLVRLILPSNMIVRFDYSRQSATQKTMSILVDAVDTFVDNVRRLPPFMITYHVSET
jgi:hypothetical protein